MIQRSEAITKTASGLVIPEKAQTKVLHGTVVAVGPGARNQVTFKLTSLNFTWFIIEFRLQDGQHVPLGVQAGDTVLLPEYGGQKVEIDDTEFHLFREADILAKVQK